MATVDDYFLDETGAGILDETGANILTTQIPKATSSTWYLSDLQSETGLDICDENGYPILMPNPETVTNYEWWTGSVWTTSETFINLTASPATITNWPDRVESFELSVRAKDSAGGIGDYSSIIVGPGQTIQPGAIASGQAMGAVTINTTVNISPGGIASGQAMGNPTFSSIQTISPGGIASAGALGAPTIVRGAVTILPGAIASAQAMGNPTIQAVISILPGGIASAQAFGAVVVVNGPVTFQPVAIASAEAMGNPTIFTTISILPAGIASAQALGAPTLLNTVAVVTGDSLFVAVDGLAVEAVILVVTDTPTIHLVESTHLFKTYIAGPPPDEIMLAAIAPVTRVTRRVDIYEADGITPYLLNAPFMDGNVTVDMGRDERRMFDLKLYNEDGALTINPDGFWYDKIIKLYRGIRTDTVAWERKLGEFMIDQASNPNFPDETNVSGRDMTKKMRQSKFQQATAFPINTPIENIILALAINSGVPADKIDLPLTGKSTGKEFFYDRETERWAAAKELANSYGYELYFTNEGVLTMTLFADPTLGQPEYTFQTGANGQIASFEKRTADARMYNHIIVTGQVDSTVVAWAEAKNTVVGHPTSIARIGDRSFFYTSAFISTTVQAQDVADKFLKIHALEQFEASLNTIVLPWLDAGTIVDFIDPDPADGDPTRYLLSSLSIPMSLGAMPSVLKRVTAVV